jgi:hypothetical protein
MRSRQTTLRPLFRWFAVVTLLAWIGAQALCQARCSGACPDDSCEPSCHEARTSSSHHGDEHIPDQDNCANASCETLKSALSGNTPSPLIIPAFSILYTVTPTALALDATAIEPVALFSRDARTRDWVSTPEECLGPAFRSLAPPVLL